MLALSAIPAFATITLNGLVPANPIAGQSVAARLTDGGCDALIASPGYPQVIRTGNNIRLLVDTVHNDDIILCNAPGGSVNFSIGAFPAGSYTLQVDRHYIPFVGPDVIETVGTIPFSVAADMAVLPALGNTSLILLVLVLAILAAWAIQRRGAAALCVALVSLTLPLSRSATADVGATLVATGMPNATRPTGPHPAPENPSRTNPCNLLHLVANCTIQRHKGRRWIALARTERVARCGIAFWQADTRHGPVSTSTARRAKGRALRQRSNGAAQPQLPPSRFPVFHHRDGRWPGRSQHGENLAVVLNLQDVTATTHDNAATLSRNCQLPGGQRAFMQEKRQVDVVVPEAREAFKKQKMCGDK